MSALQPSIPCLPPCLPTHNYPVAPNTNICEATLPIKSGKRGPSSFLPYFQKNKTKQNNNKTANIYFAFLYFTSISECHLRTNFYIFISEPKLVEICCIYRVHLCSYAPHSPAKPVLCFWRNRLRSGQKLLKTTGLWSMLSGPEFSCSFHFISTSTHEQSLQVLWEGAN